MDPPESEKHLQTSESVSRKDAGPENSMEPWARLSAFLPFRGSRPELIPDVGF
jgi:hypothetical protein